MTIKRAGSSHGPSLHSLQTTSSRVNLTLTYTFTVPLHPQLFVLQPHDHPVAQQLRKARHEQSLESVAGGCLYMVIRDL